MTSFGFITEAEAAARGLTAGCDLAASERGVFGFSARLKLAWPVRAFMPVPVQPAGWRGGVPL